MRNWLKNEVGLSSDSQSTSDSNQSIYLHALKLHIAGKRYIFELFRKIFLKLRQKISKIF